MNVCHGATLLLSVVLFSTMAPTTHAAWTLTTQPADAAAYTDAAVTLSVTTTGSGGSAQPSGVNWYFDASSASGLISPANLLSLSPPYSDHTGSGTAAGTTLWTNRLTIAPIAFANAGHYACVLTDSTASVTSAVATVTVSAGFPEVLSVQLADPGSVGGFVPLSATDSTGAFPAGNWNALAVDTPYNPDLWNYDPRGTLWTPQTFALMDRNGILSDVELTVLGASDAWRHEDPNPADTAISKLMNTFVKTWFRVDSGGVNALGDGRMQLVFDNLNNAETYSVYVYLADIHGDSTGGFRADIDAGTGVTNYTGPLPTTLPGIFVPSTNQNPVWEDRDAGNYVRLTGIAPVNGSIPITIDYYDPSWTGWGAGVCGLQLVQSNLDEVPPSITKDPADRTIYTDVTATFSVAVLGVPTPAVQWYEIVGGVTNPIPDATDLSYTTSPATIGMTGTEYFAVASNDSGTATSAPASLTVLAPAADAGGVFSVQLANPAVGGWQPLDPTDSTGAFPMTNWNAVSVNVPGAGSGWVEQTHPLNDQYGIGSGVDLTIRGASDAWLFDDPPADATPRTKLMNTFIKTWWRPDQDVANEIGEGKMQLILSNLDNTLTYNLYLYLADNDGFQANVDAGTGVTNYTGTLPSSIPTSFIASTNQDEFGVRDDGNYVRQAGITPVNGTITVTVNYHDPGWTGYGAGVCGLQLVKESLDQFDLVIDSHPASRRILTNLTATVSASVLGWPPPESLQWYEVVNGVSNPIPGATGLSYTTEPVTDATSGRGYFLVASNASGSVSSQMAIVTAAHQISPATGVLQVDQYYGGFPLLAELVDPVYQAAHAPPDSQFWVSSLVSPGGLPDYSGERIYGWFTPPVTTNYVFFLASDDEAVFLLSTDSASSNICQIASEELWSGDNNWHQSGGGSTLSQKRSDQFVYDSYIPGGIWPGGNTISLTAGVPYYIELAHVQYDGGQGASVTYIFEGEPDPADGTPTVLVGDQLSTTSAPDYLLPRPQPHIVDVSMSGSDVAITGANGLVNGLYHVVSSPDPLLPIGSWAVVQTNVFDAVGNSSDSIPRNPSEPARIHGLLSVQ